MGPVWLLLLLPSLLTAQVTPDFPSGVTVEADNSTDSSSDSSSNSTGTSDTPSNPSTPSSPPEPSGFALTPSEAPVEEDDWSPAETFLYSGDPSTLEEARCSRTYSIIRQTGPLPSGFSAPLRPAMDAVANTANFLNMIFQASDLRESTVEEDMEWYHALVRALLEADVLIQHALFTFDADPAALVPQLVLHANRNPTAKVQTIVLQDLSKAWDILHPPAPAPDDSWFRSFKFPESNQPLAGLSKRVLLNDLSTLDTPKWGQGDSYVTNRSGGIDLDQCTTDNSWFGDTHQCNRTTMECVPIPGQGFRLGQYCCRCKEGYYNPDTVIQDSDGGPVNESESSTLCFPAMPICLPCWPGCKSCQDGTPCWVQEDWFLRAGVLAVQGIFMFLIFVSMLVAYQHRRNRRIRASGLLLLETILFGSLLLYFPVFILYFRPSTFRCILLRWVRMLGFSIVYGTVTLKMYRVLKVFLSRTAQRMPYMSSLHLLRILGVMLMTVSWFLCAWTVGVLQNRDRNIPVFIRTNTTDGQGFNLCYLDRWDYMMAVAELLFLCWGSSLWTAVRPVPSAFHEPRYMGIAIHNELLLSSMFHLLRFTFPSLHPDWMLLLSFTHTHATITVTLALLFIPKFLYVSKPVKEEIAAEVYEDEVDMRRSGSYLNSSFHSVWNEPSVDPEDFRDELKKLYAQLEVHKTKKMTANNPHLSKKRSSRCTLGRSIIRRIVEIPESMSRQCSREEKDGSFRSRNVNMCDSFRRSPDTVSISYRSSIASRSPSIRKSQSDYHYVRERESSRRESSRRESSRRDSYLKPNSVKRCSQRSETDSLDIPPVVCKSASAQNLTIDTNLLHPDHTRLHKSWSLTSNNSHSMENIPKVNRSSTVLNKSRQSISISDQTKSALQSESFDKAEVCPWELDPEQSGDKNQKHVTYANSQDGEQERPSSPVGLVCPWDHLPPVEKTPSVEKSETESPKPQAPVSASAPGSPRPKVTKDQRVFSFRTTSSKWLSVKSIMGSMDSGSRSSREGNLNIEDSVSQKSQDSASTTPRLGTSNRRPSVEKRSLQKRSMTTDGKPSLVKQNAIRLSSVDSSERSPRRLVIVKSAIYPLDTDDMQKDGTYENVFLSRQNSKRSSIGSWETGSTPRTPSTHRRGSNRITPVRTISHANICPWEESGTLQQGQGPRKQQSVKADVCPWDSQVSERTNLCPWEDQASVSRRGSGCSEMTPWESQDLPVVAHATLSRDSRKQSLKPSIDVCPWDTTENPSPSVKQDANVCPWDVQDKAEVVYENLNRSNTKGSLAVPSRHEVMKTAVSPSTPKESLRREQLPQTKSPAMHLDRQVTKTTESCPWEFPDPPKLENICPWEEGNTQPTNTGSPSQMTIKADICPWDSGHQDKPGDSQKGVLSVQGVSVQIEDTDARVNVCPWDTEQPEKIAATKMVSQGTERQSDVCPWETGGPDPGKTEASKESYRRQNTAQTNVCPWETGGEEAGTGNSQENVCPWDTDAPKIVQQQDRPRIGVCPWETDEPKVQKKQDSAPSDVCPWDTNEPKVLQKQDSAQADVCPWDTDAPKVLQKQDSARESVCPWDTDAPKVLQKQDSARESVCPWDTDAPKVLQKQDSARENVCPWDTDAPKVLQKQDSARESVCPWDTDAPKVLQKQDSARESVCPWDTDAPKVLQKQDSARESVCLWDTDAPKVLQKQDSARESVCPWDTDAPKVLQKQDSARESVCPWDTDAPKVLQKQDSDRESVCPWETEEPAVVQRQDRAATEVCPWETTDPQTSSESRPDNLKSDKDDVTQNQEPLYVEEARADIGTEETDEAKENIALGRRDVMCSWEMARSRSGSFTDNASDVFTWEPENIPEEDEDDDAEFAAEALVFPPDF
ncbi:probable G-protein coupled receptor 179 [Scomber scombrus]|uniref:Probable G-protein coupled receptor 179 n=1 Tax=Scomber scombrus TaxID=13677 RepID=A0AAV1PUQ1_SCOSC